MNSSPDCVPPAEADSRNAAPEFSMDLIVRNAHRRGSSASGAGGVFEDGQRPLGTDDILRPPFAMTTVRPACTSRLPRLPARKELQSAWACAEGDCIRRLARCSA